MKQAILHSTHLQLIALVFNLFTGLSPAFSNKAELASSDSIPKKIHKRLTEYASFTGGALAEYEFITTNQRYLPLNRNGQSQLKGIIIIKFVVTAEGKIVQPSVFEKIGEDIKEDPEAEKEAFRLVRLMPDWQPGRVKKKAVNSYRTLSVCFNKSRKSNPDQGAVSELEAPTRPFFAKDKNLPIPNSDLKVVAEKTPAFPGGEAALFRFLDRNLKYPDVALVNAVEGTIVMEVVVEKDGSLTNIKIIKGLGYGCDEEAIRLIQIMPKWIPGTQNGSIVRARHNFPIRFTIK
jgi:TonB family protein